MDIASIVMGRFVYKLLRCLRSMHMYTTLCVTEPTQVKSSCPYLQNTLAYILLHSMCRLPLSIRTRPDAHTVRCMIRSHYGDAPINSHAMARCCYSYGLVATVVTPDECFDSCCARDMRAPDDSEQPSDRVIFLLYDGIHYDLIVQSGVPDVDGNAHESEDIAMFAKDDAAKVSARLLPPACYLPCSHVLRQFLQTVCIANKHSATWCAVRFCKSSS